MDVTRETVDDFYVGNGEVTSTPGPIVAPGFAHEAYKGVRVRAACDNADPMYVGSLTLQADTGYRLLPGEEVSVPVNNPSKIYVVGTPGDKYSWLAV